MSKLQHRSPMVKDFSQVPTVNINRSKFDRRSRHLTTFDADYLIPVFADEVIPADTFIMNTAVAARLATPLHPIMDNLYLKIHYFFVPNRLLWDNWQKMMGERIDPDDSIDYTTPQVDFTGRVGGTGDIHDYLGIPLNYTGKADAWWHRAYNLIRNEWYRDQNLEDSLDVPKGDADDLYTDFSLQKINKIHDYFTSCLPWPQKGDAVELPLGITADVVTNEQNILFYNSAGTTPANDAQFTAATTAAGTAYVSSGTPAGAPGALRFGQTTGLEADLSTATAATINDFRMALQLQAFLERDARGGTRYTEIITSHFGVISPDSRLQRPEYLGGGRLDVSIQPIANTTGQLGVPTADPQGQLAGVGTISGSGIGFSRSFVEHGVVLGIVAVTADITYQQGLHKMFDRPTRYSYYWPGFAHLGEQEVKSREIYATGDAADEDVFGYQERYAEYKYGQNKVSGLFRSTSPTPLDSWHMAQNFLTRPTLSESFINSNTPLDRAIAIQTEPHVIGDFFYNLRCERPIPVHSIPGLGSRL